MDVNRYFYGVVRSDGSSYGAHGRRKGTDMDKPRRYTVCWRCYGFATVLRRCPVSTTINWRYIDLCPFCFCCGTSVARPWCNRSRPSLQARHGYTTDSGQTTDVLRRLAYGLNNGYLQKLTESDET